MARGAPKGRPKPEGSGRQPGQANKNTADLKAMAFAALNSGSGGQAFLEQQKHENPVAFLNFISKFIPRDIKLDGDMAVSVSVVERVIVKAPDNK